VIRKQSLRQSVSEGRPVGRVGPAVDDLERNPIALDTLRIDVRHQMEKKEADLEGTAVRVYLLVKRLGSRALT
jgi:hypothetical protein